MDAHMNLYGSAFCCLALPSLAVQANECPNLAGVWLVTSVIRNGVPAKEEGDRDVRWRFSGNQHTVTDSSGTESLLFRLTRFRAFYRLEEYAVTGNGKVLAVRGILKVDGDTLTVCWADPFHVSDTMPYPLDFSREETTQGTLIRLARTFQLPNQECAIETSSHRRTTPRGRCVRLRRITGRLHRR